MPRWIPLMTLMVLSGCVMQDNAGMMERRMAMLEQRSADMEKHVSALARTIERVDTEISDWGDRRSETEQGVREQNAALRAALHQVREEIQIMRGQLEEKDYFLQQQIETLHSTDEKRQLGFQRIDENQERLQTRLARLEAHLNLEAAPPPEDEQTASDGGGVPTEDALYASAKAAFDRGDWQAAREGFQELLSRYPGSGHADNAQFWIGEVFYREKWYEKAILEYQKVIENYPRGNKVPAALLKQGFAFFHLSDASNARLVLKELVQKHPASNEADIARRKLDDLK